MYQQGSDFKAFANYYRLQFKKSRTDTAVEGIQV